MGAIPTVGTFLTNLRGVLVLESGLTGVNIFTGPIDEEAAGTEVIAFAAAPTRVDYRYPTVPSREVFEEYSVEGRIWIVKPGADEAVIAEARDRAIAILQEVHDKLDGYVGTPACQAALGVDDARVSEWTLEQVVAPEARDCRLTFTVAVKARFTPA